MSDDPKGAPRYMGIPTFMRTPYTPDGKGLDIALAGVPYDGGVTNRPGARHGPRQIRDLSSLTRSIHHVSKLKPFDVARVGDVGDVPFTSVYDPEKTMDEITDFFSTIHKTGAMPLTAGGDHSITFPIMRAIASLKKPIGMVHVDAHTDTWGPFQGSKFHHGGPFRLAVEAGILDPKRTVQIGIRGAQNTDEGWNYSRDSGMRVIFMEEFTEIGVQAVIAEARRVVGDGPTYISFDVDGLDPIYAPGTGTPEIGGITTIEAQALLRGLGGLDLVGADVVEVSPPFDQTGNTAIVAATMMFEILCLLAERVSTR
ncbi:MAG: agmatinase [Rhodospirillaceae bacterium]|nr:agmatinase [Rhodospirillaceae bacterium]